jgi:hypothetical protein
MTENEELPILQRAWRDGEHTLPKGLYRAVVRQTRLFWWEAAGSFTVAVVFLGASVWKAVVAPSPEFVVLAIGVWIATIAALLYSVRSWSGLWTSAGLTANDFLVLSIQRCRADLKGTTFGLWFLLVQTIFVSSWQAWYWSGRQPVPSVGRWLLAACLPIALLVVLLLIRGHQQRELRRLENLRRELTH